MTDFVVPVVPADEDDWEKVLDWKRKEGRWTLSERDSSPGSSWIQGQVPTADQIESIASFFRIPLGVIPAEKLAQLSPAELALEHSQRANTVSVYAILCQECFSHLYVFRWIRDEERWGVYGRTCESSWKRGSDPDENEISMLMRARRLSDNPLRPPE